MSYRLGMTQQVCVIRGLNIEETRDDPVWLQATTADRSQAWHSYVHLACLDSIEHTLKATVGGHS
jgi:hypothetical protein